MTKQIMLEQIVALMDKRYSLWYVDYRDNLDESLEKVQEAIHGNYELLDSIMLDWDNWDTIVEYGNQLRDKVIKKFKISEREATELVKHTYWDNIREVIEERDDSTPLKDLIRNTNNAVMFYDLGVDVEDYTGTLKDRIRAVKKGLKISYKDTNYDNIISMMCQQASYGGKLVIYFLDDLSNYIDDTIMSKTGIIEFSGNISVAIVDHHNGSGDSCEISHSFKVPFSRQNIFIDKTIKYNYTYSVCGMSSDWCQGTNVNLSKRKSRITPVISTVGKYLEREKELNAVFRSGKCTHLDMDIKRHRDTYYRNDFPCGTKCPHCGTFWID